jgi:hypothetical protein
VTPPSAAELASQFRRVASKQRRLSKPSLFTGSNAGFHEAAVRKHDAAATRLFDELTAVENQIRDGGHDRLLTLLRREHDTRAEIRHLRLDPDMDGHRDLAKQRLTTILQEIRKETR